MKFQHFSAFDVKAVMCKIIGAGHYGKEGSMHVFSCANILSIQNNHMRVICLKSLVSLDVLELLCLFVSCLPDGD